MKLGIPWRLKAISPNAREAPWESVRRARHVGERTAQPGQPRSRSDQLFALHERINQLSRQLERLHHAPAQGPVPSAPSYDRKRDQHLAEAIVRLERRMDELVNASRDMPAAPFYAASVDAPPSPAEMRQSAVALPDTRTLDFDQAMAETTTHQQALDTDPDALAFVPETATAQPVLSVESEASPEPAPVPAQNLAGLEQHLRDITSQIEALRPQPQVGEVRALASDVDNNRPAGTDANTPASIERGLAELFEALRTAFSKHNAAFSINELAGQTAIFIAACPVPGPTTAHHGQ